MYKIINTSSKPVFVEGVCLNTGDSTNISQISENLRYMARKGTVMISSAENTSNAKVLTEEGTGKKKRSSKNLNEIKE